MVIKGLMDFDSSWYLCVFEWLTKKQTKYKANQESCDQRTLRSMNSVRVQKVSQSSEGSKIVQKVVLKFYQEQAHKYMNIIKRSQGSHDINKSPEEYYGFISIKD